MSTRLSVIMLLAALAAWAAPGGAAAEGWDAPAFTPAELTARYGTAEGAIAPDEARELMLNMVNAARAAAGVPELAWSDDATAMAQAQADEMARERYGAHLDLLGRDPAMRWNALGGTDQVAENVIYYVIPREAALTPELLFSMVSDWIESPGHFANLADWHHTSLGFALSIENSGNQCYVAGVQEFLTDLGSYSLLPETAVPGEQLQLTGNLLPGRIELVGIALAAAGLPEEQTPESLNSGEGGYLVPDASQWVDPGNVESDALTGDFRALIGIPDSFAGHSAYITVWARYEDDPGDAAPFSVMTQVVAIPAQP